VAPSNVPWSFTNPILIDANGGGYTGIALPANAGEPTCPALPASCSAGAAVAYAPANSPSENATAVARAPMTERALQILGRALTTLVPPADACGTEPEVADEAERIQQHERTMRRSSEDHYPWGLIVFPTPEPTPAAAPAGQ